jgi:hypothetical protein
MLRLCGGESRYLSMLLGSPTDYAAVEHGCFALLLRSLGDRVKR